MPTARELLGQADALMRRNRARANDADIPELTDAIVLPMRAPPLPPAALDAVPELTDVVEEIEIASIVDLPDDGGEPSEWVDADRGGLALTDGAPAVAVPEAQTEAPPLAQLPLAPATDAGPAVAPARGDFAAADESARWGALAEEIRMQVMHRVEHFAATGLRAELGDRLRPIVDRATAELVATIGQQVGELLRSQIAEAIEREIEKARDGNR